MLNNTLNGSECILDAFICTVSLLFLVSEFITQVPPPPSAGAVLISALNLLEGFHLTENNNKENQTYQQIAEVLITKLRYYSVHLYYGLVGIKAFLHKGDLFCSIQALKAALAMASGLGDPKYNSSVTELLSDMLR